MVELLDRIDGIIICCTNKYFNLYNFIKMKKKIAILGSTGSIGKTTL